MLALLAFALLALPNDPAGSASVTRIAPEEAPDYGHAGLSVAASGDLLAVGAPGIGGANSSGNQVYLYRRPAPGMPHVPEAVLVSEDDPYGQAFGRSVDASGDLVVVGAHHDDTLGGSAGAAYVFRRQPSGSWQQLARIHGSNTGAGDQFGHSVAISPLGVSTYRIVVGAHLENSGTGAAYVFGLSLLGGTTLFEESRLIPPVLPPNSRLGFSVDVHGNTVALGAPYDSQAGTNAGAVYVFSKTGTTWSQTAKVLPTDASAGQLFGHSVAVANTRLAVGAPRHSVGGTFAGAAYVFASSAGSWTQHRRYLGSGPDSMLGHDVDLLVSGAYHLVAGAVGDDRIEWAISDGVTWPAALTVQTAPDGATGNDFGVSVAWTSSVVVGGAYADGDAGFRAGAVYAFDTSQPTWTHAKHLPAHAGHNEDFGSAVAVDGDVAVIGAPEDDDLGHEAGAAYVWERQGGTWAQTARLDALPHETPFAFFGTSVDASGDTVVVGAPTEGLQATGNPHGAAYVFRRGGTDWSLEQRIVGLSPQGHAGQSLALEGVELLVGLPGIGQTYSLTRSGTTWSHGPAPAGPDPTAGDEFGAALALRDGIAVVGAPRFDPPGKTDAGAAYVFQRTGTTWTFLQKVSPPTPGAGDRFGTAVDLDGERIVVGAPRNDGNGTDAGAVYTVRRTAPTTWTFESAILPTGITDLAWFGSSVDVAGNSLAIGAPFEDTIATNAGAALVYRFTGFLWSRDLIVPDAGLQLGDARGSALAWSGPNELLVGVPGRDAVFPDSGGAEFWELAPADLLYCAGKTNSLGCVPFMTLQGRASASSTSPFLLGGWNLVPNEPGFLLYGFAKQSLGFHGGTLCVKLPFRRLFPIKQALPFGPPPCAGMLERNFNNRIQSGVDPLLTVGQRVFAQWRLRDPGDPAGFGDGFTDAVRFTVCP